MLDISGFDLQKLPADFYADPFPYYAQLQARSPVRRMPDGSILLTRYRDVEFVYKNPKLFSSDKRHEFGEKFGPTPLFEHHTTSLVFNDPPLHTRVRRLINGALTPRAVAQIQPDLERWVDRLLDAMAAKESADLIGDFAAAIPIEVIGNLLGVPRHERSPLRNWSLAISGRPGAALDARCGAARQRSGEGIRRVSQWPDRTAARAERGRAFGFDFPAAARGIRRASALSGAELVHNCIFLLNAGHETTTNLIGNGLVALAEHPDQRARLTAEPELIKTAIEEFLRYESPNQLGNRITTAPVDIDGVSLPAGTQITVCIGAANRDPGQFAQPDRLDVGRSPNRHLAFASGIHQCAGMGVARLEAVIAIGRFLSRFPRYSLAASPTRGGRARFRGFLRVPCKL